MRIGSVPRKRHPRPARDAGRAPEPRRCALTQDLLVFAAIGFLAQLVDGAIGMAYGLTATSVLLFHGVPPVVASAGVHAAEVATTGLSGLAHWRLGHVLPRVMLRLALAGALGGVAGALLAVHLPMAVLRPLVSAYLLLMGMLVLRRAWRSVSVPVYGAGLPDVRPLGFGGGFLDAAGGGGWGPIVTSTLIARGMEPKLAIGTSNAAEFFVTSAVTAAFLTSIGLGIWPVVAGLVLGGALAAPFAALATRAIPARPLMAVVGLVIVVLAGSTLLRQAGLA